MNIVNSKNSNIQSVTSIECFNQLSKITNSFLVDVRTKPEWLFIGVPDLQSLNKKTVCVSWLIYPKMNVNINFEAELFDSGMNRQDTIFLICRSGNRSYDVAKYLKSRSFVNCINVIDGFEGENNTIHQRSNINGWKYYNLPWKQS